MCIFPVFTSVTTSYDITNQLCISVGALVYRSTKAGPTSCFLRGWKWGCVCVWVHACVWPLLLQTCVFIFDCLVAAKQAVNATLTYYRLIKCTTLKLVKVFANGCQFILAADTEHYNWRAPPRQNVINDIKIWFMRHTECLWKAACDSITFLFA